MVIVSHDDYVEGMQARVIAVLDWELSTLGNQMSDVAYNSLV